MIKKIVILPMMLACAMASPPAFDRVFSDHMVVQRERPIPLQGTGTPGSIVELALSTSKGNATVGAAGRWEASLPALPAGGPFELTVSSPEGSTTLRDVLVGDLWLCAGQSNMDFALKDTIGADLDVPAAKGDRIRFFKVPQKASLTPLDEPALDAKSTAWKRADPDSVGNCSAVAYHFAREVEARTGIPVGLVVASWGGTPIGAWTPLEALKDFDFARPWIESRDKAAERLRAEPGLFVNGPEIHLQGKPGTLFDGMIHPLGAMPLHGILWYQGQQNAGAGGDTYTPVMRRLAGSWREHFQSPEAAFLFVQLPNYADRNEGAWPKTREAQMLALDIPNSGMATTIDLGESFDIHPKEKTEVGRRLARIALAKVHNLAGVPFSGPLFESATAEGAGMRVQFHHASKGLLSRDGGELREFEIAGLDRRFVPAKAVIQKSSVYVWSPDVAEPIAVRHAWRNNPAVNLINTAGLPAAPFRSDGWPQSDVFPWKVPAAFCQ